MKYAPYSNSKIAKGHCPFAFKKTYIDKTPRTRLENLEFGSAVHDVIRDILEWRLRGEVISPDDIWNMIGYNTPHSISHRIGEIFEIIQKFQDKFRMNMEYVVGVEEKISINRDGKDAPWESGYLRGIIDILEIVGNHAIITDHKTQYNVLSNREMDSHEQLSFYCLLTKSFYPQVEKFTVRIYFARYGITKQSTRTMEDVVRYSDVVESKIKSIEGIEEWVPIPGPTCTICEHIHLCPLAQYDKNDKDDLLIIDSASASRAAKLLRVREVQVSRIKEALREYSSKHGPIKVSDEWSYGYVPREGLEWPVNETREVFKRHGYDFSDHIGFSASSMKKLIKRARRLDQEFSEDLEGIAKEKVDTSFKGYKT